jgi:flavin reductase (DIM6/NTAB) family NADH-FMN oxidoreductase RutF
MPVGDAEFKLALSHFASGITVVTTEWEGKPYGMTVASFASLSLHPPLVVICIEKSVKSHDAIAASRKFAVNVLAVHQADISTRFASPVDDRFAGIEWAPGTLGVPLIAHALTAVECTLREQLPGGDHSIFVGEVAATTVRAGEPLLYFRGGYREMR